ncbi:MAG: class I SAM-dependent methyltransferase [Candidatus Omnitrophica bacterium]|nr:class I SAM-dependent methyltransferase [Candidatus Omnitrophota bacterium]
MYNNIYQAKPPDTKNKRYWKNRIKAIYEDICPHHKQPGTLLDVGCSYGLLMEYFISRGWRAAGIDICENAILHAREKGLNCHIATAESFRPDGKFDVIVMDNTLEHFKNPLKSLFSLKDLLAQDGIIYIRVPNVESVILFSGFRNFLGNMKPFEHLFYFSKSALALLLHAANLNASIKLDGNVSLGNILNCYLRSKLVLKDYWQDLNYGISANKKKLYFLLKHIYGEIISVLGSMPVGVRNKELVAIAKKQI